MSLVYSGTGCPGSCGSPESYFSNPDLDTDLWSAESLSAWMFRHFCLLCRCLRVSWVQRHPWWDWNPTALPVTLTVLASLDPLGTRGIPLGFLLTQKEALHCICKRICRRPGYSEISHTTVYGQATEWSGNSQRNEIAMVWLHAGT